MELLGKTDCEMSLLDYSVGNLALAAGVHWPKVWNNVGSKLKWEAKFERIVDCQEITSRDYEI